MEIRQNYFAEKSPFREKRVLFFARTEAVRLAEETTKQAREVTKQEKIRNKARLRLAKLGINTPDNGATPTAPVPRQTPGQAPAENPTPQAQPQPQIEGLTTNLRVLHKISHKEHEKQANLAKRINNLLAGTGAKNAKKKLQLQEVGEKILREIDPTYVRPNSGDCSLETQKIVAKAIKGILPKDTLDKAEKGDAAAEQAAARKIEEIYGLLEHARNNLHAKDIRRGTRGKLDWVLLGPISRGVENRKHRKGLSLSRLERAEKFEEKRKRAFEIEEEPAQKEAAETAAEEKGAAFKPKSKLGKLAYYGPAGIPFLAHRGIFRPIKLGAQFVGEKIIKPPLKFLWEKTFGKGPVIGTARIVLWGVGSGMMGGLPVIPVVVEAAIWAAQQIKPGKKAEAVKDEAVYAAKNVANIGTLMIPYYLVGFIKEKLWPIFRLPRKSKPTKPVK